MANNIEQAYELTLVVRSQLGDEAAFAELLRMYSPRLRFYVSKMLHDRHENAEDLLQEIWLSIFRALPKLNDTAAFRAWLFRIARDRVCREFRRHRIEFRSFDGQQVEHVAVDDELNEAVDREAVRQQLDQLSTEHREALVLRFIEDMSCDDIARVTGSTLGTVRSRIHYAKRALRRAFEDKSYETK
ncbi:MAG TPA: sigma-70 family RNA polymerase sigma factor [Candidatus Limnocylindria bacterium]|nr:sigma-70 family RNA polymerase sigma factor [Candidatus Limnocylindria bacterium]